MMLESEREKIRQLNEALQRISDGTYGICEFCGEFIQENRLGIPYATCCVACKEKKRRQKKAAKALKQPRTQLKTAPAYFIMLLILVLDQLAKPWCE